MISAKLTLGGDYTTVGHARPLWMEAGRLLQSARSPADFDRTLRTKPYKAWGGDSWHNVAGSALTAKFSLFVDATAEFELCVPSSVRTLLPYCFWEATFTKVIFDDGPVPLILGPMAFGDNKCLKEVVLPEIISTNTFDGDSGIFDGCLTLESVKLPKSLFAGLGPAPFISCPKAKTSITLFARSVSGESFVSKTLTFYLDPASHKKNSLPDLKSLFGGDQDPDTYDFWCQLNTGELVVATTEILLYNHCKQLVRLER